MSKHLQLLFLLILIKNEKSILYGRTRIIQKHAYETSSKQKCFPIINEWEKQGKTDRSVLKKMGEMGFLGLEVEEEYGGMGLDYMYSTILCEELGKTGSLGFETVVAGHSYLAMNYLIHAGSSFYQRQIFKTKCNGGD